MLSGLAPSPEEDCMRSIDIHAHLVPGGAWRAAAAGKDWHGYRHEPGDGLGVFVGGGRRIGFTSPKVRFTPEERLADMDGQGVDMQDESAAIEELERAVTRLGLKGAELDTEVAGAQWDESRFLPFFKAAEAMGAVLFFHPQPHHNFLRQRTPRDGLVNSLGVILDDAIVVAILIAGGVLEACPNLRACIAHGGGPACFAMGRLDRGWHGRPEERRIPKPPSAYQRRLYYDSVVGSEKALRFLLDEVGADRVVLGSDWPFVPWHPSPVTWVQGLPSLTAEEKERILWRNLETLLGL